MSLPKFFVTLILTSSWALAGPLTLNYQGRIFDSENEPINSGFVEVTFQVMDPSGQCLLFEEEHSMVDMANSNGFFSLSIGGGTQNTSTAPNFSFSESLSNATSLSDASMGCATDPFIPGPSDGRRLRVTIDGETLVPDQTIGSTAYSLFANDTQMLDGNTLTDIFNQVETSYLRLDGTNTSTTLDLGGTRIVNVADPTDPQDVATRAWVSSVVSSAGGGDFLKDGSIAATGDFDMDSNVITNLADPSLAQDAATKNYVDTGFYSQSQLQSSGSAQVHFDNLTNLPSDLSDGDDDTTALSAMSGSSDDIAQGSLNLFMSLAEQGKLSNIEANATADMTAGEILTALQGVDGTSSSLDADQLDGQDSAYYLDYGNFTNTPIIPSSLSDIGVSNSDNITPGSTHLFMTSTERTKLGTLDRNSLDAVDGSPVDALFIDADGNVGVGTSSPTVKLQVSGGPLVAQTGTVSITNGFMSVSGTGTNFTTEFQAGDNVVINGNSYQVSTVLDPNNMNLLTPASTTASGVQIFKNGNYFKAGALVSNEDSVGIGTDAPQFPLDVNGSLRGHLIRSNITNTDTNTIETSFRAFKGVSGTAAPGNGSAIEFQAENAVGGTATLGRIGGSLELDGSSGNLVFETDPFVGGLTERMRISSEGHVGVGTTTPNHPMEVNGVVSSLTGGFRLPDGTVIDEAGDLGGGGTVTSITLGNGLPGSAITGSGTINVAGGDGIVANADDIAVDLASNPGLEFNANQLRAKIGSGMIRDSSGLSVDEGVSSGQILGADDLSQCTSNQKLQWTVSSGWSCVTDNDTTALSAMTGNSDNVAQGSSNLFMTSAERTKLGTLDRNSLDATDGSPVDALFIDAGGNVGIGTTSPLEKLSVAGVIESTTGGIKLPDGTIIDEAADLGGGGSYTCPAGFTRLSTAGRTLGCIQTDTNVAANWNTAREYCYDTYGGRLPSFIELITSIDNLPLTNELAAIEWAGDSDWYAGSSRGAAVLEPSGLSSTYDPVADSYAYRCWLNAEGGGSTPGVTSAAVSTTMTINSSGDVGIGTTSPSAKLHINELISPSVTSPVLVLDGNYSNGTSAQSIDFRINGESNGAARVVVPTDGSTGELAFYTTTDFISVPPTEKIRIDENGNVGIGTTSPGAANVQNTKLHIVGYNGALESPTAYNIGGNADDIIVENNAKAGISILSANDEWAGIHFGDKDNTHQGKIYYDNDSDSMAFHTVDSEQMRIDSSGKVGIGTTSPSESLTVQGSFSSGNSWNQTSIAGPINVANNALIASVTIDCHGLPVFLFANYGANNSSGYSTTTTRIRIGSASGTIIGSGSGTTGTGGVGRMTQVVQTMYVCPVGTTTFYLTQSNSAAYTLNIANVQFTAVELGVR